MYISPHHHMSNNHQTHWWAVSDFLASELVSCIGNKHRAQQPLVMTSQRDQESQYEERISTVCHRIQPRLKSNEQL